MVDIGSFLSNNSRLFLSHNLFTPINGKIGHHQFLFLAGSNISVPPPESPRLRCIGKRSGPPVEQKKAWLQRGPVALGFSLGFLGFSLKAPQKPKAMTERNHKLNSFGKKNKFYNKLGGVISKDFPKIQLYEPRKKYKPRKKLSWDDSPH